MAKQMSQTIRACTCCLQYEGGFPRAPLCPIVATSSLDLLHVDITSIRTTLEPIQSPRVTNILVFQDHFTKHVLAYVAPDQTVKTIAKFLYGGYVPIFKALARILSNIGASFTSNVIEELCKILGIKQLCTMPYHPRQAGREIAPDDYVHDWEAGRRQKKPTSHLIWLKLCMPIMPPNPQLLGIVHTTWCSDIVLGSQLTLSSPLLAAMRPHERGLCQVCGCVCSFHMG